MLSWCGDTLLCISCQMQGKGKGHDDEGKGQDKGDDEPPPPLPASLPCWQCGEACPPPGGQCQGCKEEDVWAGKGKKSKNTNEQNELEFIRDVLRKGKGKDTSEHNTLEVIRHGLDTLPTPLVLDVFGQVMSAGIAKGVNMVLDEIGRRLQRDDGEDVCERVVMGKGNGKGVPQGGQRLPARERKRPEPPWAKVRNISDMLVESIENINRPKMQKLEEHKNQTERLAEEGAKPAEDKVIDEEMPDNKVIDEEMRQSRKQIERWHRQGDSVIKRGCVLCWPDKASCSSEICRARTMARLARSPSKA